MVTVTFSSISECTKGPVVMVMMLKYDLLSANKTLGEISQEAEEQALGENSLGFPFLSLMWLLLEV